MCPNTFLPFVFKKFPIFQSYSFLSPNSSQTLPPSSQSPNITHSLSLKNKKYNNKKVKVKTDKWKKRKAVRKKRTKSKSLQKTWSLFCIGQLLKDMGPALEYGWLNLVNAALEKAGFSLSQKAPIANSFSVQGWNFVSTSQCLRKKMFVWFDLMCHATVSVSSFVYKSCCVWKALLCLEGNFLGVTHHL